MGSLKSTIARSFTAISIVRGVREEYVRVRILCAIVQYRQFHQIYSNKSYSAIYLDLLHLRVALCISNPAFKEGSTS